MPETPGVSDQAPNGKKCDPTTGFALQETFFFFFLLLLGREWVFGYFEDQDLWVLVH